MLIHSAASMGRKQMLKSLLVAAGMLASAGGAVAQNRRSSPEEGRAEGAPPDRNAQKIQTIGIVLFDDFETLDVGGPVEMWGRLSDHRLVFVAQAAGPVRSSQGVESLATFSFDNAPQFDIIMVPGGLGTRREVNNEALLAFVRKQDKGTQLTISVCTGAAILARAGLLDGRKATTNKLAFKWVTSQGPNVDWVDRARWMESGKYITSSGVSAGTDMSLAVVEKLYGRAAADLRAKEAEYVWNDAPGNDPFAVEVVGGRAATN